MLLQTSTVSSLVSKPLLKKIVSEDHYYQVKAITKYMLRHQPVFWLNQKVLINLLNLSQKL